jgi:SAM-dependent methyltransferase
VDPPNPRPGPETGPPEPRWFSHRDEAGREEYAHRFRRIAARGEDIDGEARFVDALARRRSTILDAGCGTGRVAAALARSGHAAYGVDVDPLLIERGREFHPGLPLAVLDLALVTPEALAALGFPTSYDVIVCPGNVMHFVGPGTEPRIVANLAAVLEPGGRLAFGFFTGRDYTPDDLDADAAAAGLTREHRFATWELHPSRDDSDWAVSVYTR